MPLAAVEDKEVIGAEFPTLLTAAQDGDGEAFAKLWSDAHPGLVRYTRALAGAAGEDVASETWLAVLRGLKRFTGNEASFRSWLFTIARHKLIDLRRRRAHQDQCLSDLARGQEPLSPDTADLAADQMGTEAALTLITRLPAEQAEIILLRVLGGLEVAQVAVLVGKSPGAVRVAAHRGLRRLADLLGGDPVTLTGVVTFRE